MEWKKGKNIILLVLICANLLLAGNLFAQIYGKYEAEHKALVKAVEMIENAGADIDYDLFKALPKSVYVYEASRDREKEKVIAETGLGKCEKSVLGGGIEEYSSNIGKFVFRNGGLMSGELYGMDLQGGELKLSKKILSTLGIYSGDLRTEGDIIYGTHRVDKKYEIANMDILLEQTGKGVKISGKWIGGDMKAKKTVPCNSLDLALSVMKIKTDNPGIKQISDMQIVYSGEMGANGQLILSPVLKLETNVGDVFFDLQNDVQTKI